MTMDFSTTKGYDVIVFSITGYQGFGNIPQIGRIVSLSGFGRQRFLLFRFAPSSGATPPAAARGVQVLGPRFPVFASEEDFDGHLARSDLCLFYQSRPA